MTDTNRRSPTDAGLDLPGRATGLTVALLLVLLGAGCRVGSAKTDQDRIADVHAIASFAEQFKEATGFYPLADLNVDLPIAVHLSTRPLPEVFRRPPGNRPGEVMAAETFHGYLRSRVETAVELPKDDRRIKDLPYFYVYMFDGTDYFVAAVLEQATEDTRNVADRYEKYEVGSKAVPDRKIQRFAGAAPRAPAGEPYRAGPESIPRNVDRPAVLELLRQREFDRLESIFDRLAAEARRDLQRESDLDVVLRTFGIGEPWMAPHTEAWVETRPDSKWAHVARARYLRGAGFRARGGKWASETETAQFDEMERLHRLAVESAHRALEIDDRLLDPYVVLIGTAKTTPTQATCESLTEQALAIEPASYRIWHIALKCQSPRWGGSLVRMHRLAREAQQHADRNPRLRVLLGYVDLERGDHHRFADRLPEALEAYDRALTAGEHHTFYEQRAIVYSKLRRYEEALADQSRALELSPQDAETLARRALSLASLGRFDEMRADLDLATRIEPTDSTVEFCHETKIYRRAGRYAYSLYKEGRIDEARRILKEILEHDPDHAYSYHCLGLTYKKSSPYLALSLFEKAIQKRPDYYEPYRYVHWLRGKKGEWQRVLTMWTEYLAIAPAEPRAYSKRAEVRKRLGDEAGAASDLREACGLGYEEACEDLPPARPRPSVIGDERSRYDAQPTPDLAWQRFLELNAREVTDPDLGIYDSEARAYLRSQSTRKGQQDLAARYRDERPEIRVRDDLAVVVFPEDPDYRLSPWFFRQTSAGWQLNGSMYPDVIGYNHENQWRFKRTDHPYGWAFADYVIDKNGFAQRRRDR